MDPQTEINQVTAHLHHTIVEKDEKVYQKIANHEANCYENAKDNIDTYVKCMKKLGKSIEYHEKILNFKAEFVRKKYLECFNMRREKDQSVEPCKQEAIAQVEKFVVDFRNAV